MSTVKLRQRAEYTYKHNAATGRHGWLRLTPAYSLKIVEELIGHCERPMRVFDPFCGTATTALSAAYHSHEAVTTDINPFLVWLGKAKTDSYDPHTIAVTEMACHRALQLVQLRAVDPAPAPPIHNIERWWDRAALMFLRRLRAAIDAVATDGTPESDLLLVAFCRCLIAISNAAFNHQSMSFKESTRQMSLAIDRDLAGRFAGDVRFVLAGASDNPEGAAAVILGDSRAPGSAVEGLFDLVVTSPPYANRMSYIRELRPYMYWLEFLLDGRDAGELDWSAIGGTWGVATSRLLEWERSEDRFKDSHLESAVSQIALANSKNGGLLANYVAKYFDDMWAHFQGLPSVLAQDAEVHYVIGNSTFYGVLLSTEQIYAQMLASLGFKEVSVRPLRKRNSKKELVEYKVSARWPG